MHFYFSTLHYKYSIMMIRKKLNSHFHSSWHRAWDFGGFGFNFGRQTWVLKHSKLVFPDWGLPNFWLKFSKVWTFRRGSNQGSRPHQALVWLCEPHNHSFFKCGVVRTHTPPTQFIYMLFFQYFEKKILEILVKKFFCPKI